MHRKAAAILLVLGCLAVFVSCPPEQECENLAGDRALFKANIEQAGFVVDDRGQMACVDPVLQYCAGVLPCALGQNADSPYTIFKMDPTVSGFASWGFKLRPDEALVFMGKTPPELVYFSFTAFLNVRYYPELQHAKLLMANLGDSLNQLTIKASGSACGDPFDADTVVIVTADRSADTRVRDALQAAGFSPRIINTMVIPSDTVRLGTSQTSDRLCVFMRCAFFQDEAAGNAYLGIGDEPAAEVISPAGVIWRITPDTPEPAQPIDPLPAPPLRVHGTGSTEFDLWPDVENLRAAILSKYADDYDVEELDTVRFLAEGAEAIQRGVNVLAPSRDTVYLRTPGQFDLADGEFVVVYGVNHAAAGKALYCNAILYDMDPAGDSGFPFEPNMDDDDIWRAYAGLVSVNSENSMQDSAQAFLPEGSVPTNACGQDLLYARKFTRACDPADSVACTAIPPSPCARVPQQEFCVAFRAYVEPDTQVGPAYTELVYDRVIKFTPKAGSR